jgi:hypothetical protein
LISKLISLFDKGSDYIFASETYKVNVSGTPLTNAVGQFQRPTGTFLPSSKSTLYERRKDLQGLHVRYAFMEARSFNEMVNGSIVGA